MLYNINIRNTYAPHTAVSVLVLYTTVIFGIAGFDSLGAYQTIIIKYKNLTESAEATFGWS